MPRDRLGGRGEHRHLVRRLEEPPHRAADERVVVQDEDAPARRGHRRDGERRAAGAGAGGSVTRKVLPRSGALSTSSVPPAAVTMPWQAESPSPAPAGAPR